jgi:hypothetical protein
MSVRLARTIRSLVYTISAGCLTRLDVALSDHSDFGSTLKENCNNLMTFIVGTVRVQDMSLEHASRRRLCLQGSAILTRYRK